MIWLSIILIGALAIMLIGKLTKYWFILMSIFLLIVGGVYLYLRNKESINHPIETIKTHLHSTKI